MSPVQTKQLMPQHIVPTRGVRRNLDREFVDPAVLDLNDVLVDLASSPDLALRQTRRHEALLVELDELEGLLVDLVAGAAAARREVVELRAGVLEPADGVEAAHLHLPAGRDGDVGLRVLRVLVADDVRVGQLADGHGALVLRAEAPRHDLAHVLVLRPPLVPRVRLLADDDLADVPVR